ncbi:MAG: purine-binding chemotaxis protein CheW [Planctomycetes bacterium]|nr:purine-binding chemotaxis protein CheW [Planctomycetota bacterium]
MADTNNSTIIEDEEEYDLKDRYLTFYVGREAYGIPIKDVIEIIGMQSITPVPETEEYIKGVINLRGKVIPVLDIRMRFNMPSTGYDERTCIVVVVHGDNLVGLVVDQVADVIDIPEDCIDPSPQLDQNESSYVDGVGQLGDEVKMLLSLPKLLAKD